MKLMLFIGLFFSGVLGIMIAVSLVDATTSIWLHALVISILVIYLGGLIYGINRTLQAERMR